MMARVGFVKTWTGNYVDQVGELFNLLKDYVEDAGFLIVANEPDAIDFMRKGATANDANDDLPHWALDFWGSGGEAGIRARSVFGISHVDPGARVNIKTVYHYSGVPIEHALRVWFAADGEEGWWWIHGMYYDAGDPVETAFSAAGLISRRYPADHVQGLCARYGVWTPQENWGPPYVTAQDGSVALYVTMPLWSALGLSVAEISPNGLRHAGSPLPRLAVPVFPARQGAYTAAVLGEFTSLMMLTDGFSQGESVMPGWIAMAQMGDLLLDSLAVPAPAAFDDLDAGP